MTEHVDIANPAALAAEVKRLGRQVGFDRVGITPAAPLGLADFLRDWLARGYAGQMGYLARNVELRDDPRGLLDNARSVICLARGYAAGGGKNQPPAGRGAVARYARHGDYHRDLRRRAHELIDRLARRAGGPVASRVCVDTAPVLERELAARAGLGWIGKNGLLNHPRQGSYFLLAEIVTTLAIAPDAPIGDHCGRCRRCIDACPTGAIVAPGVLNASRCIGYLTIELRDAVPLELRDKIGNHLFGCDRCQSVCPFNSRSRELPPPLPHDLPTSCPPAATDAAPADGDPARLPDSLDLREVADWDRDAWRRATRDTAGERATWPMWVRNAIIALGNLRDSRNRPLLERLARSDSPLIAEHATWALHRLDRP